MAFCMFMKITLKRTTKLGRVSISQEIVTTLEMVLVYFS